MRMLPDAVPTPSALATAPLPEVRSGQPKVTVLVPIQRVKVVPLTAEHRPMVQIRGVPDFSLNPRFKAMLATQRGLTLTTGRAEAATLYRVAPGDSLYAIAKRLLGNGNRWRELYQANSGKLQSPSLIRVGMTLAVPGAAPTGGTYHVARGDSLYVIAAKTLKNPARWREIAQLNRARLKGGTVIYPNQVLLLPSV
jgi:nucleoid-associated protein YgaU